MCPRQIIDSYPLSPVQEGLLFNYLYANRTGVDVEQVIGVLPEVLDLSALEDSWQRTMERHTALRTTFRWEGLEKPAQDVWNDAPLDFSTYDWRDLKPDQRERNWEQLILDDRRRGFRLDVAPPWRLTAVRTRNREYRILATFHHILIDARGLVTLFYEALSIGDVPACPVESPTPYRKYIDWLESRDPGQSETYWRTTLKGFTYPTPLPETPARHDPSTKDQPFHEVEKATVSARRTRGLRQLARRNRCTLNMMVMGAWALLLGRYSGEDDVVFGVVRACRKTPIEGLRNMVGLLVNTLPLRLTLPAGQPVLEWLKQLRERWVSLRSHEHSSLSDIQSWSELPPGLPLFQTLVNYHEPDIHSCLEDKGGAWRHRRFSNFSQPVYPISLEAGGGSRLTLKIHYDPLRFSRASIQRMLVHLENLLQSILTNPHSPLEELPILTPEEQQQLLVEWNGTKADYPDHLCVHHLFEEQASLTPYLPAVADEDGVLTYRQLNEKASTLALELHRRGVGPDVCVGVCIAPSTDFVVAILAVLKAGGAYVPLDPSHPAKRRNCMLADARAQVLITHRNRISTVPHPIQVICLDKLSTSQANETAAPAAALAPAPRNLAYVIFTSGSTGRPKGVAIEHRNLTNLITWHRHTYQVTKADRATQIASPAFDASVWELWPYLTSGASVHIPPDGVRNDPSKLVEWLADRRITLTFLATPLAEAAMEENWPSGTSLRAILTGGDRLRHWPQGRLPCTLVNHYGPTETTVVATSQPLSRTLVSDALPSIGRPISNTEVYVLDPHRQPVPIGIAGELYIGGAGLARGYYGQPELTQERFIPHPFKSESRLYRTGDRVRWQPDGRLEFLGRLDDQIKIRGYRIETGEIQAALDSHPAVRESRIFERRTNGTQQMIAYFIPTPGESAPKSEDLEVLLRTWLPAYMIPDAFVAMKSWPRTSSGKIARELLPAPEPAETHHHAPTIPSPQGETEAKVARVLEEVLGQSGIGAEVNFFAAGGHSLRAAQAVSRLNAALSVRLSIRDLFENPTVRSLSRLVEKTPRAQNGRHTPALVRIPRVRTPGGVPKTPFPEHISH